MGSLLEKCIGPVALQRGQFMILFYLTLEEQETSGEFFSIVSAGNDAAQCLQAFQEQFFLINSLYPKPWGDQGGNFLV